MLRALRAGGTGQFLMAAVVSAIIVVFIVEFRSASSMRTGSLRRECAARVDGECITPKDFMAEFGLVVPRGVPAKQVKAYSLRRHVLDGVIERELLVAEAHRLGLSVDDEDAKEELRQGRAHVSLPTSEALRLGFMLDLVSADESGISRDLVRELPVIDAKTQEVDDDLYARVVRSMTNRSPKEFLKMQERELLAARMRDLVRARVRVSEEEAFDAFQRARSRAVVRFARLDPEWFVRYAADTSDAAADRFSFDHKTEVDEAWKQESSKWKAGCPLASEIVATFQASATEADKTLAQEKIERAKQLVDSGEPFALVAREVSDGATAATGGELGCLAPDAYGEGGDALTKAAEALAPGAVSGIVETKSGYHLVKLDGRLADADVEKAGRRFVAKKLAARTLGEDLAKQFGEKLISAVKGGARLDDTTKALAAEFAKDSIAAERAATKAKKSDKSDKSEGDKAKAAEANEEEPAALADPRAPKAEVSAPFTVDGDPVPGAYGASLGRTAFGLEKPDDVVPEPIQTISGLVVMQLKEKTVATREEFAKEKAEVTTKLEIEKRSDALARYVARLRQAKQDKIEVSARILEDPKTTED
jgi:peptidyl-prolyl cis-trans isomerase D